MFKNLKVRKYIITGLFAFTGLGFTTLANSAVNTIYNFGTLLTASSGYTAPTNFASSPFANLEATNNGGGEWIFMLTINSNFSSSFGSNAYIGSMSFDFSPEPQVSQPLTTFVDSNSVGMTVGSTNGTGSSGLSDIDFGTKFGQGAGNRLSQNEWVKWEVSGLNSVSALANMYVHVQGINGGYSAKYTPVVSAIPEPETYAMLLAGLGLLGFAARKKISQA